MGIRQFLDLSTAHVSQETRLFLDEQNHDGFDTVWSAKTASGWIAYAAESAEHPRLLTHGVPADLVAAFARARALGCDYILFDADADTDEVLMTFEWPAEEPVSAGPAPSIADLVSDVIDEMIGSALTANGCINGDIDPLQAQTLDDLKQNLTTLVTALATQNAEVEEDEDDVPEHTSISLGAVEYVVSFDKAPVTASSVAYGHADGIQIFAEYENADRALLAKARELCSSFGSVKFPALIALVEPCTIYVQV